MNHLPRIFELLERTATEGDDSAATAAAAELFDLGLLRDEMTLNAMAKATRRFAAAMEAFVGPSPFGDLLLQEAQRCEVHRDTIRQIRPGPDPDPYG